MPEKYIPLLEADDIECRVQSVVQSQKGVGAILLLYKNARVDMRILDEVYGPMNWQRHHEVINGALFCSIDIWDEDKKQWIRKQDVGSESNAEKSKGQASDSFKRAGTNVGIGRELYTAPFIWVQLNDREYYEYGKQNGKPVLRCSSWLSFSVSHVAYGDKRRIQELTIVDNNGVVRFTMKTNQQATQNAHQNQQQYQNQQQRAAQQDSRTLTVQTNGNYNRREETASAEPQSPKERKFFCEQCGATIQQTKGKKGRIWSPREIAQLSHAQFGMVLCPTCQKIAIDMPHTG